MEPSEEIRKIWEEMKALKRMIEQGLSELYYANGKKYVRNKLERKYEEIEILFGHESTLSKAIIFYLDNK